MRLLKLDLPNLILIITGFYLLYRKITIFSGDPFLLYIGLLTMLFYLKEKKLLYLLPGFTLVGAGVSQLIIANNLPVGLRNQVIIIISLGLSLIGIFIINNLIGSSSGSPSINYYWPLGLGIVLIIISLIYHQGLEAILWQILKTYWPVFLLILVIVNNRPRTRDIVFKLKDKKDQFQ